MPAQSAWTGRRSAPPWSDAVSFGTEEESQAGNPLRSALNRRLRKLVGGLRTPRNAEPVGRMLLALNEAMPRQAQLDHLPPEWRALEIRVMSAHPAQADVAALYRLLRLVWLAGMVFGDTELAHDWLSEPKVRLHGKTPLQLLHDPRQVGGIERWLVDIEEGNGP